MAVKAEPAMTEFCKFPSANDFPSKNPGKDQIKYSSLVINPAGGNSQDRDRLLKGADLFSRNLQF